jgi:transglutaminase-like putative cysteine protease
VRSVAGWRLRTEHLTTFRYSSPARASYNEVRQIPLTTARQTTLEARVQTSPIASQYSYWDYWGTQVVAFNVDGPHDELTVHGLSLVETQPPADPPDATWDDVAGVADRHAEFLSPSRYTHPGFELTGMAEALRAATPLQTVEAVVGWVHDSLEYVRGVTDVHTSATEAFAAGSGVCQDFAHLALAVLRAGGIPSRYVSGYLHPDPEASVGGEAVGESHAWVEAWAGDWWGLDPTNGVEIGRRHVVVARGRDYADVAPVRGIYAGNAEHRSSVTVRIARTA